MPEKGYLIFPIRPTLLSTAISQIHIWVFTDNFLSLQNGAHK